MSYRDDRPALRDRAETLEHELVQAREEIERLRGKGSKPPSGKAGPPGASLTLPVILVVLASGAVLMPLPAPLKVAIATLGLMALIVSVMIASLLVLARPAEAVVLSGGPQGFRAVVGGRVLRVPLVEHAARLDLGIFRLPLSVKAAGAYELDVVAHARLCSSEPGLSRAIERYLGADGAVRDRSITHVLDPVLRRIVQQVGADVLETQHAQLADLAKREAEEELDELGVELVSLFVLRVRRETH